jgi:solute:Na+ symporter, SSS family
MVIPQLLLPLLTLACVLATAGAQPTPSVLTWQELPALPDGQGFGGSYAGVSGGALIVAGGANFPDQPPWAGGSKVWHDTVFVLDAPDGTWRRAGRLPQPAGYGLSLTVPEGILVIGGGDVRHHFSSTRLLRWQGAELDFTDLPSLPVPLAMMAGAVVNRTVYVAAGLDRPEATQAQRIFLALDLDRVEQGWRVLEPWPGPERFLATGGALDGAFYLFGGTRLVPGSNDTPQRESLRDAWSYSPGRGWRQLADLPTPMVATPGPAPALGASHLLMLGGDDGSPSGTPPDAHPGFPRTAWMYHSTTDSWAPAGALPFSLVTSPAVTWNGRIIVPGGESRPGVRSTTVWSALPRRASPSFGWLNTTTLAVYLGLVAGMGLWFMRRQKTTRDYFKGGGRVPWWVAGLSIFATMLSSITFMAVPAKAYATNWLFALGGLVPLALAPLVIAFYLPFFRQLNVTSAYEYLERRFNLAVRLYASASFILFQTGRMAVVIFLPALALSAAVGVDIRLCVVLIGVICTLYTAAGGIEAVVWTDAVQAIVLLGAAVLSLILIAVHLDGTPATWWAEAQAYQKLQLFDWSWDLTTASVFVVVVGGLLSNLAPYTADQAVVQRYITTTDTRQAARAIRLNAWLSIPSTVLFFGIGTALFLYYRQHPNLLDPTLGTDAVFPLFIIQVLPPGVAGLVIAGIFAAAQSTASSSVNSVATAIITDWVRRYRPQLPDRFCLRLSQVLSLGLGLGGTGAALYLASADIRSLWDAYLGLLGLLASGLAGLFVLGIFSTRTTGTGALVGAIASALALASVQRHTSLHFLAYGAVGVLTCVTVGWLASWILPARNITDLTGLTWRTRPR